MWNEALTLSCAALLLLTVADAQTPPNGTVGTLDFRYPDYIVMPLVPCPTEGVFPHPNDCKWYYRCYDRYGYGRYWRAYFQCEPGTVFSDQLDQCVWIGDDEGCETPTFPTNSTPPVPNPPTPCIPALSDCRGEKLCPPSESGPGFAQDVELCFRPLQQCGDDPPTLICPDDAPVYDNTNSVCIANSLICPPLQDRPSEEPEVVCENQLSQCTEYHVCRPGAAPQLYRLCQINTNCYSKDGRRSSKAVCPFGYLFNSLTNQCVKDIPTEDRCPEEVFPTRQVPCVMVTEHCEVFTSCESRQPFLACSSYYMCGVKAVTRACPRDELFASKYGRCVKNSFRYGEERDSLSPTGGSYSPCTFTGISSTSDPDPAPPLPTTATPAPTPDTPAPTPDTPAPTPDTPAPTPDTPAPTPDAPRPTSSFDFVSNYQCSFEGERPDIEHAIALLDCNYDNFCIVNDTYPRLMRACTRSWECVYDSTETLKLTVSTCPSNEYYSSIFGYCSVLLHGQPCPEPVPTPAPTFPPTPTTPPTVAPTPITPSPNPIELHINITISCGYDGEIPAMPVTAKRVYCQSSALCSPVGGFLGMQQVCSHYYKCIRNPATRILAAQLVPCDDPAHMFSPQTKTCIVPQTNICAGRFYFYPGMNQPNSFGFSQRLPFSQTQPNPVEITQDYQGRQSFGQQMPLILQHQVPDSFQHLNHDIHQLQFTDDFQQQIPEGIHQYIPGLFMKPTPAGFTPNQSNQLLSNYVSQYIPSGFYQPASVPGGVRQLSTFALPQSNPAAFSQQVLPHAQPVIIDYRQNNQL